MVDLLVEKQDEDRNFTKAFTKLDNSVVTLKKASSHFLSVMLSHKPITKGKIFNLFLTDVVKHFILGASKFGGCNRLTYRRSLGMGC